MHFASSTDDQFEAAFRNIQGSANLESEANSPSAIIDAQILGFTRVQGDMIPFRRGACELDDVKHVEQRIVVSVNFPTCAATGP